MDSGKQLITILDPQGNVPEAYLANIQVIKINMTQITDTMAQNIATADTYNNMRTLSLKKFALQGLPE